MPFYCFANFSFIYIPQMFFWRRLLRIMYTFPLFFLLIMPSAPLHLTYLNQPLLHCKQLLLCWQMLVFLFGVCTKSYFHNDAWKLSARKHRNKYSNSCTTLLQSIKRDQAHSFMLSFSSFSLPFLLSP